MHRTTIFRKMAIGLALSLAGLIQSARADIPVINADLPGQIMTQVAQSVYDMPTGWHLLIPQDSCLCGSAYLPSSVTAWVTINMTFRNPCEAFDY